MAIGTNNILNLTQISLRKLTKTNCRFTVSALLYKCILLILIDSNHGMEPRGNTVNSIVKYYILKLPYDLIIHGHCNKKFKKLFQSEPKKTIRRLERTPTSCDLKSEELSYLLEILLRIVDSLETAHDFEIFSHHLNSVLCSDFTEFRKDLYKMDNFLSK